MSEFDPGPERFAELAEELQLTVAARKTRDVLETHVHPRVGWLLHAPEDRQPPARCCRHLVGLPGQGPTPDTDGVLDWLCPEGLNFLCQECAEAHTADPRTPHQDPELLPHRLRRSEWLGPLTATVQVVRPVRTSAAEGSRGCWRQHRMSGSVGCMTAS